MRKYRLLTATLMLGTAVGMAAAAAPAASAALRPVAHVGHVSASAMRKAVHPDFNFSCPASWFYIKGGFTRTVNATGIHIRNNPQGGVLYSIAKGESFKSKWSFNAMGDYGCRSPVENPGPAPAQRWILGWDVSNPAHTGWIGATYLS